MLFERNKASVVAEVMTKIIVAAMDAVKVMGSVKAYCWLAKTIASR